MSDDTRLRQLYSTPRHPYYIVAPDYRRTSAGIRVMHQLCQALRQSGQEAWILADVLNPDLDTPKLTDEIRARHKAQGLVPIGVYPEIVGRNPLDAQVVVRYILNRPGLLGERPDYGRRASMHGERKWRPARRSALGSAMTRQSGWSFRPVTARN